MNGYPELKSYKKKDIDEFLLQLNAEHLRLMAEKEDEIKRLYSECEYYKKDSSQKEEMLESQKEDYERKLGEAAAEYEKISAKIGERFLSAEKAADAIVESAKAESAKILSGASEKAEAIFKEARKEAESNCEEIKKLTDLLYCQFNKAMESVTLANKHLDGAVEAVSKSIAESGK